MARLTAIRTRALYRLAAAKAAANVEPGKIEEALVRKGADPETAATVVRAVLEVRSPRSRRATAVGTLIAGTATMLFGACATLGSLMSAHQHGGWFILSLGPVLFGAHLVVRGLHELIRAAKP